MQTRFQEFETLSQCPVCGGPLFHPAFPPDIQRCEGCGVHFRSPRPTQADIGRSYDGGSTYDEWATQAEAREALWRRRAALLRRHAPPGRLLDVGTGDGHFLSHAKTAGFEPEATELSETGIAHARERGFAVRKGQLTEIDFGGEQFDAVTMWHVLEHVPDPGAVLQRIYELLKPGGVFAVAVPNEDNHLFRHRIGLNRHANPIGEMAWGHEIHLTHFQPATLKEALRRIGFEIVAFGVDDVYLDRRPSKLMGFRLHQALNALTGWNFAVAMACVCRKPSA